MRAFDMSRGYPVVVVEESDGWTCGECSCRGATGLCLIDGIADATRRKDDDRACGRIMTRLDRYNEKKGTFWRVVNEYPLEIAEALF